MLYLQTEASGFQPLVDMYETREDLVIEVDLPGVLPEDMLVKVCDDAIIIEGVKRETPRPGTRYLCMERKFRSFRRVLNVPVPVDAKAGKAAYREGVLTIRIPKTRETVIRIKVET